MTPADDEALRRELQVACALAQQAGARLLRHQAAPIEVLRKAHDEVVTAADRESDQLIRQGLLAAFPGDAVYSEETADTPERLQHRRVWIVDPLDGTSNFIAGGDEYCISIGLAVEGAPVLGVVYNPRRRELFAGGVGLGVRLNGAPVHPSSQADPAAARLAVSRKEVAALAGTVPCELVALTSMAYKLARVAAGLEDGALSAKRRKEWGSCAGAALVLAAGGRVTLLDGTPLRFNCSERPHAAGLLAAGAALHASLIPAVTVFTMRTE
jgi:myo-inositol-1(or 4)-monophosphatase